LKTSSLSDIAAANVCTMKKPEVSIMFLRGDISIVVPAFFGNCGYTVLTAPALNRPVCNVENPEHHLQIQKFQNTTSSKM
jgi:hypothetical protein